MRAWINGDSEADTDSFHATAVIELQKENEYSLGKILRIGNRDYSDLDELIVAHIKQMAVKVNEMVNHEKWRGTKDQLGGLSRTVSAQTHGADVPIL